MAKKILVADDDPAIVESITMILDEFGYDFDSTVDGQTIYKMESDFPDLLLLDIWMSGQDGREIARHLKNNPITRDIPIIMVSASRDIEKSAKDAGADDFLPKPFNMFELIEKIERNLKE